MRHHQGVAALASDTLSQCRVRDQQCIITAVLRNNAACVTGAASLPPARATILEVSVYDITVSNKWSSALGFGLYHTGEVAFTQKQGMGIWWCSAALGFGLYHTGNEEACYQRGCSM